MSRALRNGTSNRLANLLDEMDAHPEIEVGKGLTVQLMNITPEVAQGFLANVYERQRRIKKGPLASIARDLDEGRFRLNGETIVILSDGKVADGQHRLTACVQTGRPFWSLVVRGVDPAAYPTIDITSKRTGGDALTSDGYETGKSLAAAAGLLYRFERGLLRAPGHLVLSPVLLTDYVAAHPGLAQSVKATYGARSVLRSDSVPSFVHYILASIDRDEAELFFDKIISGANLGKTDPVLALRRRTQDRLSQPELIHLIVKAWNFTRRRTRVQLLKIGPNEEMPMPDGFDSAKVFGPR